MGAWEFFEGRVTRVFYPYKDGVLVTDRYLVVHGRHFALDDLADLGWRQGSIQAARKAAMEIVAVETGLVILVMALGMATVGPSAVLGVIAALYILIAGAVVWVSSYRWPTPLLLCGDYRDVPTVLFISTDPIEFHKVCRAVMRAVELNDLDDELAL